jgi:pilus assembly protein TadC
MKFGGKKAKPVKEKRAGETEKISPTKYYFTYGVFRVKLEDMGLFVEEVAVLIEKRGITEIDVYASSSKVPRSNKKSNEELSQQRADDAMIVIRKELQRMGYEEGVHYKFRKIDSGVNGKEYENDAKENKDVYERYQYVELSAEG